MEMVMSDKKKWVEARREICEGCEFLLLGIGKAEDTCKLCDCNIKLKTADASAECPAEEWEREDVK